jgi:hypothetical protein
MYGPNGGLAVLVLCKPLATLITREIGCFAEFDFAFMKPELPRIYDGAHLNLICQPSGTALSVPVMGEIHCIWN